MKSMPRIIIAEEGERPERQYFDHIGQLLGIKFARPYRRKFYSDPQSVLEDMRKELKRVPNGNYEAWIIIDRDMHPAAHIQLCVDWTKEDKRNHLALTNPCIELWLLFHFYSKIAGKKELCNEHDKLPDEEKAQHMKELWKHYSHQKDNGISIETIGKKHIKQAIKKARDWDTPPCSDYPHNCGSTLYYMLQTILP